MENIFSRWDMGTAKVTAWHTLARREWPALVAALMLLSPILWWSFDRRAPVTTIEVSIVPPQIRAGDTMYRSITVERHRICETDPDIVIVDGLKTRWRIEEAAIRTPGHLGRDTYKVPIVVPPAASPGKSELRITVIRVCNPIQRVWPIVEVLPPIPFVILPADRIHAGALR